MNAFLPRHLEIKLTLFIGDICNLIDSVGGNRIVFIKLCNCRRKLISNSVNLTNEYMIDGDEVFNYDKAKATN